MEGGGLKCLALVIAVVVLMVAPDPALGVEIVIECSQPDCTNKCTEAYGNKLISATCEDVPFMRGKKICVCKHK
ncbi:Uncharacterized protein Pyn_15990 [Prunus yedoensis var. nudiflora]|uniref:Uncharacterized protein n=1 Tax=Prunus yedoensis var. nudiflora TaxID=2094558 RepID=A0A314XT84_PRUYE|nr:Uncharacterized protein Pyn_15990 [Prunus yedoensis var. nudiflora]